MAKKESRIIIDTNLWISFLLTNDYSKLDLMITEEELRLLFSQELLDEFVQVSQRPKFKKYFSVHDLENLLLKIIEVSKFIQVKSVVSICRDPKDNFLLALAKEAKATHLITGDKDLLSLRSFGRTKIVTMTEFLTGK